MVLPPRRTLTKNKSFWLQSKQDQTKRPNFRKFTLAFSIERSLSTVFVNKTKSVVRVFSFVTSFSSTTTEDSLTHLESSIYSPCPFTQPKAYSVWINMPSSKKSRGRQRRANRVTKTTTLKECAHGGPDPLPEGHVLLDVMTLFETAFQQFSLNSNKIEPFAKPVIVSIRKDYPEALFDDENRSKMKEMLLSLGTAALLSDEPPMRAIMFAESVVQIDHLDICLLNQSKAEKSALKTERKIRDLYGDDIRGVIRFFAKRLSCACLDKMNDEVKRQKKKGICYNCDQSFDFTALMECSCCSLSHYCSKDCQAADWPRHKQDTRSTSS